MKKLKSIFSAITLTILLVTASCGVIKQSDKTANTKTETSIFPKPTGYVNDFENILTDAEEKELTALIKGLESQTSDQISIVTLTGLEPYDNIDDYSFDLANYWGVGQKDKNNGILIAIGKELRKIRIQNGFGIEKRLTDAETKRIIDEVMIPEFKNDNYFEGLKKGVEAIIQELK
ncbi:MAG TPA: TPM domain-containing protein [Cryomorphaceae bacterium]|nr:TPM domain-containing protein [Cryomorphaceae bacterium]